MRDHGQALIELAVFGSFLILLLGVLINYGLNFEYRQQAEMAAFRVALGGVATEDPSDLADPAKPCADSSNLLDCHTQGSASVLVINDRHIPSPSSPFAIGAIVPVTAQASMIRDHLMNESAVDQAGLRRTRIVVNGSDVNCPSANEPDAPPGCTTEGFRTLTNVPPEHLPKYKEIYGSTNVCSKTSCGGGEGDCLDLESVIDPNGNRVCVRRALKIRILDSCEGEIISLEGCRRIAAMITNRQVCEQECNRGRSITSDPNQPSCSSVCSHEINTPWYAQAGALDQLFAGIRTMGIQPTATRTTRMNTILSKTENNSQVRTASQVNWTETATRKLAFRIAVPPGTIVRDIGQNGLVRRDVVTESKDEHSLKTWTTSW